MRLSWWCLPGMLFLTLAWSAPAAEPAEGKSALESDPSGWVDLLPGDGLKGWKRVPIPPGSKLNAKNPWAVDPKAKLLICDGVGIHEMLLYDKELADGIFHVEWRVKQRWGKKRCQHSSSV